MMSASHGLSIAMNYLHIIFNISHLVIIVFSILNVKGESLGRDWDSESLFGEDVNIAWCQPQVKYSLR